MKLAYWIINDSCLHNCLVFAFREHRMSRWEAGVPRYFLLFLAFRSHRNWKSNLNGGPWRILAAMELQYRKLSLHSGLISLTQGKNWEKVRIRLSNQQHFCCCPYYIYPAYMKWKFFFHLNNVEDWFLIMLNIKFLNGYCQISAHS